MNLRRKTNRFPARLLSDPSRQTIATGAKGVQLLQPERFEKSRNATYQGRSFTLRQNTNHASNTTVGSSDSIEKYG
jgi:hypothetical protein